MSLWSAGKILKVERVPKEMGLIWGWLLDIRPSQMTNYLMSTVLCAVAVLPAMPSIAARTSRLITTSSSSTYTSQYIDRP
jgi:hypothetical protein